jgi:hypothetical protein
VIAASKREIPIRVAADLWDAIDAVYASKYATKGAQKVRGPVDQASKTTMELLP